MEKLENDGGNRMRKRKGRAKEISINGLDSWIEKFIKKSLIIY